MGEGSSVQFTAKSKNEIYSLLDVALFVSRAIVAIGTSVTIPGLGLIIGGPIAAAFAGCPQGVRG